MDVNAAGFRARIPLGRAEYRRQALNGRHCPLRHVEALKAAQLRVEESTCVRRGDAAPRGDQRIAIQGRQRGGANGAHRNARAHCEGRRKARRDQDIVVDLQRLADAHRVVQVELRIGRRLQPGGAADNRHVLRVLEKVAAAGGVVLCSHAEQAPQGAGLDTDDGLARVHAHRIAGERELRRAEFRRLQPQAKLAGGARQPVRAARDARTERCCGRRDGSILIRHQRRTLSQLEEARPRRVVVVGAQESARCFGFRRFEAELIEARKRPLAAGDEIGEEHGHGDHRVLRRVARLIAARGRDRIHRRDALAERRAVAPAQPLVAGAHAQSGVIDALFQADESVVQVDVAAGAIARFAAQIAEIGIAAGVDEIVEVDGFEPDFDVLRAARHTRSALHRERRQSATVVEVAVVEINRSTGAAVASADQSRIALAHAADTARREFLYELWPEAVAIVLFACRIRAGCKHECEQRS